MPKLTENNFTINGKSGKVYSFPIYTLETLFKPIEGIYIFNKRHLKDEKYTHKVIYIGSTTDLSSVLKKHPKESCIKENEANCICVISIADEKERDLTFKDIVDANTQLCN